METNKWINKCKELQANLAEAKAYIKQEQSLAIIFNAKYKQLQAELDKHKQPCKWKYDKWGEVWRTECDNAQEFMEGDVKDNRYKFCPYCGRKILEKK